MAAVCLFAVLVLSPDVHVFLMQPNALLPPPSRLCIGLIGLLVCFVCLSVTLCLKILWMNID